MKTKKYSETIANVINTFLTEDEWNYSFDEDEGVFRFNLSLNSKIKSISYVIRVRKDSYLVYAVSPVGVDAEDKKAVSSMAEFICRINYGLNNGSFDFDVSDGEITYRCFVDCNGIVPTSGMVETSIHCPGSMFKRYGDGIVNVAFGYSTAEEAAEHCEELVRAKIRALLREMSSDNNDVDPGDVRARLAQRLGGSVDDEETDTSDSEPTLINPDLFDTKETEGDED